MATKLRKNKDNYVVLGSIRLYTLTTALTTNVTTAVGIPAGSLGVTTNVTGRGRLFYADGAGGAGAPTGKWQALVVA